MSPSDDLFAPLPTREPPPSVVYEPASPFQRIGARLIDGVLFWLGLYVAFIPWGLMMDGVGSARARGSLAALAALAPVVGWILGFHAVLAWMMATRGDSPGKRFLHIRVDHEGQLPGFGRGFMAREIGYLVLWFTVAACLTGGKLFWLGPIVNLVFLVLPSHRTLHDRLCNTTVVEAGQ